MVYINICVYTWIIGREKYTRVKRLLIYFYFCCDQKSPGNLSHHSTQTLSDILYRVLFATPKQWHSNFQLPYTVQGGPLPLINLYGYNPTYLHIYKAIHEGYNFITPFITIVGAHLIGVDIKM